jgi:mannose-1-phosphate guanylyltransferase/phosphomannomutase
LNSVKAFVLCAGRGERPEPLSTVLPKCLWPIGGKPCVRVIVERLRQSVDKIYICCLEKDFSLYAHEFRDFPSINFLASAEPWGTAGQILSREARMTGPDVTIREQTNAFLIHYGDCLVDVDFKDLLRAHRASMATATLVLSNRVRSEYGRVELGDAAGYRGVEVVQFEEKPFLSGWTWTGIAVLSPNVIEHLAAGKDFGKDIFPQLLSKGALIYPYKVEKPYIDIGNIRSYLQANELASRGELFVQ